MYARVVAKFYAAVATKRCSIACLGASRRAIHQSPSNRNDRDSERNTTHFGFQTVYEDEKEVKVAEVFHNVANKYDLMNDAMSFGIHRLWKDTFVRQLNLQSGLNIVDVGGGTGKVNQRVKNSMDKNTQENIPNCAISVIDINQSMLDVGKTRGKELGYQGDIKWIKGDAENLPVKDSSADLVTAAFAIRNVTNIRKAISEAYRILTPGGRFSVLEFSHVTNPYLKSLYDTYSFEMIPVMGEIIAEDWKSYQYLVESIRQFPTQSEFADMFKQAGFRFVRFQNLTFGTVAIHSGFKI
ncbi:uncharacterized protein TRIADDRAFT_20328 [Trichoplax adhaerens]|uniref:2-methoxy-6-polyprenyl-1,4-benzoquinol methylase, mitochondrial n=1 Tax=Trichoplax adhaerens TaxID=10228 RepID=B3RJV9_TRIAD|nr:hypothetical protein TRIADDRAFT_20328 [Trichoplax adhaerens]EDV29129.1 hypothetical protein TRIADDRAFT_20328 [Trichoplax adhaerens]|eukprot:XP_002108331.1 hypothetical protein TRIADDRAFT_20328 [Trichoplax adhaerens]